MQHDKRGAQKNDRVYIPGLELPLKPSSIKLTFGNFSLFLIGYAISIHDILIYEERVFPTPQTAAEKEVTRGPEGNLQEWTFVPQTPFNYRSIELLTCTSHSAATSLIGWV